MTRVLLRIDDFTLDDRRDLVWYFNEADGDYGGLRSSFGAQIDRLRWGLEPTSMSPFDVDSDIVERLERTREAAAIYRRLQSCGSERARVLRLVFERADHPASVAQRFGELSGLARELAPSVAPRRRGDWFLRMCRRPHRTKEDEELLALISTRADVTYRDAIHCYLRAKTCRG